MGPRGVRGGRRDRRALYWLEAHVRHPGWLAFALNRLSGLILVAYLTVHLVVLSLLARGPSGWDSHLAIFGSRSFLVGDVLLIAAVLFRGVNGLRVTLLTVTTGGVPSNSTRSTAYFLATIVSAVLTMVAAGPFSRAEAHEVPEVQRRFAGRPTNSPPGVVPGTDPGSHSPAGAGAARSLAWPLQALIGVLLVAFVGVHLVAQHLLAPGGLRDFTTVLAYLRQPVPSYPSSDWWRSWQRTPPWVPGPW